MLPNFQKTLESPSAPFVPVRHHLTKLILGIVRTNLVNNYPGGIIGVTAARLFQLVMGRRVEDGARAIVHAAVSPQGKEYHGNFLLDLTPQTYVPLRVC